MLQNRRRYVHVQLAAPLALELLVDHPHAFAEAFAIQATELVRVALVPAEDGTDPFSIWDG